MTKNIKIATEEDVIKYFKEEYGQGHRKKRIYGFYNSKFNQIITDEHLMLIPIDERMATRAHAVFDVIYVKKLRIINLDAHLHRLLESAKSVAILPPLSHKQMNQIIQLVMNTLLQKMIVDGHSEQQLIKRVFGIRMTISSGFGDFGIASIDKQSIFYMSVFEPFINYELEKQGVNEYVVKIVREPKELVHAKTVNYIDNALMANQSKLRGGYQGIKALVNGVLLEASVANIAFMFGKQFATPRLETVIEGTTIKKLLKYIQKLKEEGVIEKISFRDITIQEAQKTATEMMVIGGDKIVPVLNFNDKPISPKKGQFTRMFQLWYQTQNQTCTPIFIKEK